MENFKFFLKWQLKPKVLENLKRSWEKPWKVMEIEELKIARTLKRDAYTLYFFLMLWMGTITKCYKTFFLSL